MGGYRLSLDGVVVIYHGVGSDSGLAEPRSDLAGLLVCRIPMGDIHDCVDVVRWVCPYLDKRPARNDK